MCNDPLKKLRQNEDFVNEMLSRPFNSYSEFKQREEDTKVLFLIKDKYLKLLGKFIENTYPDLRFNIYIKNKNQSYADYLERKKTRDAKERWENSKFVIWTEIRRTISTNDTCKQIFFIE